MTPGSARTIASHLRTGALCCAAAYFLSALGCGAALAASFPDMQPSSRISWAAMLPIAPGMLTGVWLSPAMDNPVAIVIERGTSDFVNLIFYTLLAWLAYKWRQHQHSPMPGNS